MELNKNTVKLLAGLIFGGVAFHWALQNLSLLRSTLGSVIGLLSPFLLGGAIAFILNVPMRKIETLLFSEPSHKQLLRMRRPLSLILTFLLVIAVMTFAVLVIVPGVKTAADQAAAQVPRAIRTVEGWLAALETHLPQLAQFLPQLDFDWQNLITKAANILTGLGSSLLNSGVSLVSGVVSGVATFFIAFVFSIYLLIQKETLSRQCKKLTYALLPERWADRFVSVAQLSHRTFASFLSGQCIEAVILGSLFAVVLTILRLPYAPLIGVLIALSALVPIVGAFIGCGIGALLILMVSPWQALEFIIVFLILQQIEGNLIYPHVVGSSVGLPSIWVLTAVSLGGNLMGVLGMLLFIPLCSVCYALLREFTHTRLQRNAVSPEKWGETPAAPAPAAEPTDDTQA